MKTYVVIPHYFVDEYNIILARNAIKSFRKTSDVVIVSVDDGSPIKTDEIKDISDVYIQRSENGGFSKCCNSGFKHVVDKQEPCYIICANNDIEVFGDWHEEMVKYLKIADMVGGLGYKGRVVDGKPIDQFDKTTEVSEGGLFKDWLFPGGFWMMTDKVTSKIGILDENFIHGGFEDIDYFWRAKQEGLKLLMTPNIRYWHKEGATRYSSSQYDINKAAEVKNRAYFENKHGFDAWTNMTKIFKDNRYAAV